jgi:hypothetical protein
MIFGLPTEDQELVTKLKKIFTTSPLQGPQRKANALLNQ